MFPFLILILLMAIFLVVLILKPELGMQFKAFTEKIAFNAEWTPSKGTKWRFVFSGIFIEIVFLVVLLVYILGR